MRVFMLKPVHVTALREAALPRAPGHAPAAGARASRRAREPGDRADAGAATARGAGGAGGARPVAVGASVEREAPAVATPIAARAPRFITSQRGGAEAGGAGRGRRSNPRGPAGCGWGDRERGWGSAPRGALLCAGERRAWGVQGARGRGGRVLLAGGAPADSRCSPSPPLCRPPRRLVRPGCWAVGAEAGTQHVQGAGPGRAAPCGLNAFGKAFSWLQVPWSRLGSVSGIT